MGDIVMGGNPNPNKPTAESIDAWQLGGNTIGADSNKIGTLDDKDFEVIRNNSNALSITKDLSLPYVRHFLNFFTEGFNVSDKGDMFLKAPSNNGNSKVLEFIYDYITQTTNIRLGLGVNLNTGNTDTLAFDADVYLPLQPNLTSLATDASGKIIAGSGGGGVTTLTKAALDALVSSNSLVAGGWYLLTDAEPTLYGGTTILIQAVTTNTLGVAGNGVFYTPKYDLFEIWQSTNTYAIGDKVAWGGYVWQNTTGNAGSSVDDFTLDATDWTVIAYNLTEYNFNVDEIKYNYSLDQIYYRADKLGNVVDGVRISLDNWGVNNIKNFKWGMQYVSDNKLKDNYCVIINVLNTTFWNNNLLGVGVQWYNNILGVGVFWVGNILGNNVNWNDNILGNNSIWNDNILGTGFEWYGNTLGNSVNWSSNILGGGGWTSNILGNNVNWNNNIFGKYVSWYLPTTLTQSITALEVKSNCTINIDLSTATTIYGTFSKTISKRQDGTLRLSYINNSDVMLYVDIDN